MSEHRRTMASDLCPGATGTDATHRLGFDADNAWLTCYRCGETWDALTGRPLFARPHQDAESMEGEDWEKVAARAYTEHFGFPKGEDLHPEHDAWPMIRAIVAALRARLQQTEDTPDAS